MIALMMALVFAPIIGLHVATAMLEVDTPTQATPAPGLAAAPIAKDAPG